MEKQTNERAGVGERISDVASTYFVCADQGKGARGVYFFGGEQAPR